MQVVMWKDFLHFSQGEKRGMLVLCILILMVVITNLTMPYWLKSEPIDFTEFKKEVDAYYAKKDSMEIRNLDKSSHKKITPFWVDTVSSAWLISRGMPSFVAKNLVSFRDIKGTLAHKEIKKVYGMTDSIFQVWEPYFVFSNMEHSTPSTIEKPHFTQSSYQNKPAEPAFKVDINTADTAIFSLLYGIGPAFSERIVKYRNLLGGYANVDQILEVYGMDSTRFLAIKPYLNLDSLPLRKLQINSASIKALKNHPYLNFYQAKAIYEFRKDDNWIKNWNDFLHVNDLDTTGLYRIKPYLSYDLP